MKYDYHDAPLMHFSSKLWILIRMKRT